jgi:hypothetical protein
MAGRYDCPWVWEEVSGFVYLHFYLSPHEAPSGREVPRWASTGVEDGVDSNAISVHP